MKDRLLINALILTIGVAIAPLTNAKPYSNALFFIGCCVLNCLFWLPVLVLTENYNNTTRRMGLVLVAAHIALVIWFSTDLPLKKEAQRTYDQFRSQSQSI